MRTLVPVPYSQSTVLGSLSPRHAPLVRVLVVQRVYGLSGDAQAMGMKKFETLFCDDL